MLYLEVEDRVCVCRRGFEPLHHSTVSGVIGRHRPIKNYTRIESFLVREVATTKKVTSSGSAQTVMQRHMEG